MACMSIYGFCVSSTLLQVTAVVKKLPIVSLRWSVGWEDNLLQQPATNKEVGLNEKVWLKVPLGMECVAKIELARMNPIKVITNTYSHTV